MYFGFQDDEMTGQRDEREREAAAAADADESAAEFLDESAQGGAHESGSVGEHPAVEPPGAAAPAAAGPASQGSTAGEAPATGGAGDGRGNGGGWNGSGSAAAGADVAELQRLQAEIQALNDRHLRLAAEFDNYRKRVQRERSEQHNRSQAALAARLLDALDDLQRVEHFDPAQVTAQSLLEALELVERKFRQALEAAGLSELAVRGEIFDPNTMEAVMAVPAEHPEEDDVVAEVYRKGYRFGGTLVRPAQVAVKKYEA